MNRPFVSVIIPAYNAAPYIADTLASLDAQRFRDFETIVINDGSPDTADLERVLVPYRNRIVYLRQPNSGPSAARNAGIRAAQGDLLALLDSDDLWEPDYLEAQVEFLDQRPEIDVVYCDAVLFGDPVREGRRFMELLESNGDVTFEALVTQRCNVMVSVTARRNAIVNAGLFDETLRRSEDFDLWLRVLKTGHRIAYHRRPLIRRRLHAGSLTTDVVAMCRDILRVLDKAGRTLDLTPAETQALQDANARFRARLRLAEGRRAFFNGDVESAVDAIGDANRFLRSRKLALVLVMLRLAPRLLLHAYGLRDRLVFGTSTRG